MRSPRLIAPHGAAWVALGALAFLAAVGLRSELLAREGLAGWDFTLQAPGGSRDALRRARHFDPWRADLSIALGLCPDLPMEEREAALESAIGAAPAYALGWLALGALRAETGDERGALALYRAAERLDPAGSATQIRLAALAIDLMDLESALPHLRRAAALSPDARLIEALSMAVTLTADPAVLDGLVPPGAKNHLAAARYLEQAGIAGAAEIEYDRASAEDPVSRAVHDSHVRFHLARGERGAAIGLIRSRLGTTPRDVSLRLQLTQLLMDEGRREEAAGELRAAGNVDPGSDAVANQRAVFELEKGDPQRAVVLAQALVDHRPDMAAARVTLARALWRRGDRPGAARELSQAEALDGSRAEVQLLLARLNREIGNDAEAAARYRRAIAMGYTSPAREELSTLTAHGAPGNGG